MHTESLLKEKQFGRKTSILILMPLEALVMLMDLLSVSSSDGKNYLMMQFEASFNLGVNPEQN